MFKQHYTEKLTKFLFYLDETVANHLKTVYKLSQFFAQSKSQVFNVIASGVINYIKNKLKLQRPFFSLRKYGPYFLFSFVVYNFKLHLLTSAHSYKMISPYLGSF